MMPQAKEVGQLDLSEEKKKAGVKDPQRATKTQADQAIKWGKDDAVLVFSPMGDPYSYEVREGEITLHASAPGANKQLEGAKLTEGLQYDSILDNLKNYQAARVSAVATSTPIKAGVGMSGPDDATAQPMGEYPDPAAAAPAGGQLETAMEAGDRDMDYTPAPMSDRGLTSAGSRPLSPEQEAAKKKALTTTRERYGLTNGST